jgi:hypothetical protein
MAEQPAHNALTRRDAEPAGANCAHGGTAIRAGTDRNNNDVLDDGEVDSTEYVCDGATRVLVRKDPIEPGGDCPTGGTALQTGSDANGNGMLDDAEIEQTTRLCGPADLWEGDFTAAEFADPRKVAALLQVRVVAGTLVIDTAQAVSLPLLEMVTGGMLVRSATAAVSLPALKVVDSGATIDAVGDRAPELPVLQRIGGNLRIDGTQASDGEIAVPALTEVDGDVQIGVGLQGVLALPALRVVGDVVVLAGSGVTRIELRGVERIAGSLILGGPQLTAIAIPSEHTVEGSVEIGNAPQLTDVELGTTTIAGDLLFTSAPQLETLALNQLTSVHGSGQFAGAIEMGSVGLDVLELPALAQSPGIVIAQNRQLTTVRLSGLVTAGKLDFEANPRLSSVSAPKITTLNQLLIREVELAGGLGVLRAVDFGALTTVTDTLEINGATLVDLSGLGALQRVSKLRLINIDRLVDLHGLVAIAQLSGLQINANPALTALGGLEAVTQLPGGLDLELNPLLISVAGLSNMTRVEVMKIQANAMLAALSFPSLTGITGDLNIASMPALDDLSGFSHVQAVGGTITFSGNPKLSPQEIMDFEHQVGR